MWLFLAFLAVPLIEIALFIQVGGAIGLWPTLAIVVLTAIIGTWAVRSQGLMAMDRLRGSFRDLNDPTEPLAHGAMILVAGVLLLTPGFFTDALGFALLTPPLRQAMLRHLRKRIEIRRFEMGPGPAGPRQHRPGRPGRSDIIDGDYREVTPERDEAPDPGARPHPPKRPTHPSSGWTRH